MWRPRLPRRPLGPLALGLALLGSGCVERILQIRSDPPGAEVFVNGRRAGLTPLDHRFDFYGNFDIGLRSPRHISVHRLEKFNPPWYELPPLDFFAENVVPFEIRSRRQVRYVLEPARPLEDEDLEREESAVLRRMRGLEEKQVPAGEEVPLP